ncbi:MAG: ABC transporter permease [Sphaerochaeta sp.]|jgi:ribose transport system permease protein|nr:ABC transporter permease [Sphaerochaeta sp.]MDX9914503.1 ABC transporter permease [Sphaerochaeta sp.]
MKALKSMNIKRYAIFGVLVLLVIFFSMVTNTFLTTSNLLNISRQVSMLGISAVGMTCVILTSGIDLSVGSVMAIVNIIGARLMTEFGLPILPAAVITLFISALVGLLNGVMISYVGVPAFIVTLATMISLRGLAYVLCGGMPVWGMPDAFRTLGQGYIGPIPVPVVIMLIVFALGWVFLNRTRTGRYIYGLGGNQEAVRLAGIKTTRVGATAYIISSLLTGLAGLIMLSRINTGQPKIGTAFEMDVITAVVLGGVSMRGGSGSILGVLVGVFITGILSNGMILLNISEYYQQIAKGLVLLFAVTFDTVANLRKA